MDFPLMSEISCIKDWRRVHSMKFDVNKSNIAYGFESLFFFLYSISNVNLDGCWTYVKKPCCFWIRYKTGDTLIWAAFRSIKFRDCLKFKKTSNALIHLSRFLETCQKNRFQYYATIWCMHLQLMHLYSTNRIENH